MKVIDEKVVNDVEDVIQEVGHLVDVRNIKDTVVEVVDFSDNDELINFVLKVIDVFNFEEIDKTENYIEENNIHLMKDFLKVDKVKVINFLLV